MKQLFNNHWYMIGIMIIIILGIVLFSCIPAINIEDRYVGAILGLVGVLATFIVVSNYAQVKEVENKFRQETIKLKDDYNIKLQEMNQLKESIEKTKAEFSGILVKNNFLLNDAVGNVLELNAEMNFDKGFYLNMIHNYINAIRRYDLIERHKANREKVIETLSMLLENTDWNRYEFIDEQEINIFISDIQEMDFIDIEKKQRMINQLKTINGIKISKLAR